MQVLQLQSELVDNALKTFLVVGTTFNYGEDLSCKGRILVFDILDVVPEPGKPLTRTKLKCLFDKDQKGPVIIIIIRHILLTKQRITWNNIYTTIYQKCIRDRLTE